MNPDLTVPWSWATGDVAIWHNRATEHCGVNDFGGQVRLLQRVTLTGDLPGTPTAARVEPRPHSAPMDTSTKRLDPFDRDLCIHMLWWAPYGGPPESEVAAEFGAQVSELRERFIALVESGAARSVERFERTWTLEQAARMYRKSRGFRS